MKLFEIMGPYYAHTDHFEQLIFNLRKALKKEDGGNDYHICLEDVLELHFMDKERIFAS